MQPSAPGVPHHSVGTPMQVMGSAVLTSSSYSCDDYFTPDKNMVVKTDLLRLRIWCSKFVFFPNQQVDCNKNISFE